MGLPADLVDERAVIVADETERKRRRRGGGKVCIEPIFVKLKEKFAAIVQILQNLQAYGRAFGECPEKICELSLAQLGERRAMNRSCQRHEMRGYLSASFPTIQ